MGRITSIATSMHHDRPTAAVPRRYQYAVPSTVTLSVDIATATPEPGRAYPGCSPGELLN